MSINYIDIGDYFVPKDRHIELETVYCEAHPEGIALAYPDITDTTCIWVSPDDAYKLAQWLLKKVVQRDLEATSE